jgi:glutathione S-transferase
MKLYLNKASPYARLVQVVAHEKALADKIELVWTDPWKSSDELLAVNPYSKVPTLVTDDGISIVESGCICDYLDSIGTGRRLMPAAGPGHLTTLVKYGLGRGLIDAAFGVTIERRYGSKDSILIERWSAALTRAAGRLERQTAMLDSAQQPDMGDLAIAVGLSYADFRLSEVGWRATAPRLSRWSDRLNERPSMHATKPE